VIPAEIKKLIGRLDPGSFTALMGALVTAEATTLGIAPDRIVMSDALTENDEGLDGILYDVPNSSGLSPSSALPSGLVGLQFKTTRRKQPTALKLSEELRKTGPRRVLISGGTYVLAWSQDLNYPQREAAAQALRAEAETVLAEAGLDEEPKTAVWDAQTLSSLSVMTPLSSPASGSRTSARR